MTQDQTTNPTDAPEHDHGWVNADGFDVVDTDDTIDEGALA